MKRTLTILLILISGLSMAQNYKLFNANSKKLFSDYPSPVNSYSISFDTAYQTGLDSVYFNYFKVCDTIFPSDSCVFWGSGMYCHQQNVPSWIGKKIIADNNSNYQFFNLAGDTLKFGFNLNTSDTLVFYQDLTQKFKLVYESSNSLTVLNNIDSARVYKIIHTDLSGNTISSALNQQNIIIAKNWGLTQFFQVDSFPQVLKPLSLIGNVSPNGGLFEITNNNLYDYQIGDEFQYHEYGGPPWASYNRYRKHIILNKTITADSLKYNVAEEYFEVDSLILHLDTISLNFNRSTLIGNIPFELFDGSTKTLKFIDYCGGKYWTYSINSNNDVIFCPYDSCWGGYDTQGPPVIENTQFVLGLGTYNYDAHKVSPPPVGFWMGNSMNYFSKNGNTCGSLMRVGIDEYSATNHKIFVNPNPASSFINITSPFEFKNITIFNMEGRKLISKQISGLNETIETKNLSEGIYFAVIQFADNTIATKKIVIIRNQN
ncbi:MAG: T9SS type A sorting domain-containing protein [Bacteroidetes bacterium]|nr:T9SS type A sorting domain-containing protein [Bacteroidota bacterium]